MATDFLQGTPTDQYLLISQIQVGEGTVPVSIVLYIEHISQERDSYSTCLPSVYAYHT